MPMVTWVILTSFCSVVFPYLFDLGSLIFVGRTAGGLQGYTQFRKNAIVDVDKGRILPKRLQDKKDAANANAVEA